MRTSDGVCDANDQCPGFDDNLIGTACDDGDVCTTGETYDSNCNCSGGVFQDTDNDGVCDANDICSNSIVSFPYSESFESGLGDFIQGSGDDLDWTRNSGGTPSNNTGPGSAADGSWYMFVEASGQNNPSKTAILVSPWYKLKWS